MAHVRASRLAPVTGFGNILPLTCYARTALASSTDAPADRHGCCDLSIAFRMTSNYIQQRAQVRTAIPDSPPAMRLTAVVVEGRDSHKGSDLFAVERPEFRQFRNETADQNGPDA